MKKVITVTLQKDENFAIRDVYSNLEKAVKMCEQIGLTDSYMIVYRSVKLRGTYSWQCNGYYYVMEQHPVQ